MGHLSPNPKHTKVTWHNNNKPVPPWILDNNSTCSSPLKFTQWVPSSSQHRPVPLAQMYRPKAMTERMQATCEHISKIWTHNSISHAGFGVLSSANQCCKLWPPSNGLYKAWPIFIQTQFTAPKPRWSFLLRVYPFPRLISFLPDRHISAANASSGHTEDFPETGKTHSPTPQGVNLTWAARVPAEPRKRSQVAIFCYQTQPEGGGLPLAAYQANLKESSEEKRGIFYLMVSFCLKYQLQE